MYTIYRRSEITKYNRTAMGLSDRSIGLGWLTDYRYPYSNERCQQRDNAKSWRAIV